MSNPVNQLPNPTTPLAFLPPTLASQFEASRYLYVASLSAYIWDWLTAMPDEYHILRTGQIRLPVVAYFVSRVASLAYLITSTIFQVAPVGSCQGLQIALGCCFAVAVPATSSLFLLRVRAVFSNNLYITLFFGFLWLATLGGSITVPFAITGGHIGPTDHCVNTGVKPFSSAGIISNTGFDTLVFVFISYKLASTSFSAATMNNRLQSVVRGRGLHGLSKAVLKGGQIYYLATVGLNIVTMVLILSPSVPPVVQAMFTVPDVALESAMACRVFRAIRLGAIPGSRPGTQPTYPHVGSGVRAVQDINRGPKAAYQGTHVPLESRGSGSGHLNVEMERVVHVHNDYTDSKYPGPERDIPYHGEV